VQETCDLLGQLHRAITVLRGYHRACVINESKRVMSQGSVAFELLERCPFSIEELGKLWQVRMIAAPAGKRSPTERRHR
jgi:hypothetical protein